MTAILLVLHPSIGGVYLAKLPIRKVKTCIHSVLPATSAILDTRNFGNLQEGIHAIGYHRGVAVGNQCMGITKEIMGREKGHSGNADEWNDNGYDDSIDSSFGCTK